MDSEMKKAINRYLSRLKKGHQTLCGILGGIGFIVFWYGLTEIVKTLPILGQPIVALLVGLGLMSATGLLVVEIAGKSLSEEIKPKSRRVSK